MSGIYLLASILCLAIGGSVAQFIEGNYNVTAACTTVPPGTQLGSIVSCDYYYVCTKNGPVQTNCPTGYSYDYKAASCSPSSSVSCYYGMDNPCEGKVGDNWVPVIGTCSEWVYCKNDVASGSGTCVNSIFNPDTQSCAYGTCTENPTTGPNLENLCKVIKPSSYFGSTSDCAIYYYCYPDGSMGDGVCPNGAFVAQYGACGYDTNGNCDRITDSPVPNTCTNSGKQWSLPWSYPSNRSTNVINNINNNFNNINNNTFINSRRIMKVYLMKVLQMSLKDDQQRFIYKTLNFK
ncbi:GH10094 [Drosophila grimshawi]|uniref:GH10094 n=1 Tax=Drosophila grimshawi TaxID=7222 RepID=B4JCS2_DROGR|nr:GH10094 [Drosophila grimshawi]